MQWIPARYRHAEPILELEYIDYIQWKANLQARAMRLFLSQAIQFTVVERLLKMCS